MLGAAEADALGSERAGIGGILAVLQNTFSLVLLGHGQRVQRGVGQFTGTAVTILGILGHALGDHLIECRRNLPGAQLAGPRGRLH